MSKENALFPMVKDAITFDALWQQANEMVNTLSGNIWTDTGEHDPGITLLQSVTWNIADLSYRTSLSLNDLLTFSKDQATLFPIAFAPEHVLTCHPVTAEDYRRVLLDLHSLDFNIGSKEQDFLFSDVSLIKEPEEERFHWWYNIDKREYSFNEPTVVQDKKKKLTLRGNVCLSVIPTRYTETLSPENRTMVEKHLADFLTDHRNLGERVSHITWLQPVIFSPRITIELSENISDVNQVAAQIYQNTEAFLRPPVTRYTTKQRRTQGESADIIFEGPFLKHGWQQKQPSFIASEQIALNLSLLVNRLLDIPGVSSLRQLSVPSLPEHITAVDGDNLSWQVASGYYPLLWGEYPLETLAGENSPVTLITKGGIACRPNRESMASYLTKPALINTTETMMPAGRLRDLTTYVPVGQRLPECYRLQQPVNNIDTATRALHQFLLPADQLLADGCAELALLPKLLAFTRRGNAIRGTRWPYLKTSVQQDIHQSYANKLTDIQQRDAAIFLENNRSLNQANFARELDFIQYLLGYFGTQQAALPITLDKSDFLATQREFLACQPELGYDRMNIRIDRVSALQKRIAARIGLGSICFADKPKLNQLPFYLIEHRQLIPLKPDSNFNVEQNPTGFTVNAPIVTLTQQGSAGKIIRGQLIDLLTKEGVNSIPSARWLLVISTDGDQFSVSTANSQQLHHNLKHLENTWKAGNLRWQNSDIWLKDMNYRLNYAKEQPENSQQRRLKSNPQSPYPTMVSVGDSIILRPAPIQYSASDSVKPLYRQISTEDWSLEATIKAINPIEGTLLIEKSDSSQRDFPIKEKSFLYQWNFSHANATQTDRFSFVMSAIFNRRLLDNTNIVPDKLVTWVQETIMAEFPAHVSLINHWLDEASFKNFGITYQRWQNNGAPLSDDAFAIMKMLTLGELPTAQLDIGLMRIATEFQRIAVVGNDGNQWHREVILQEELFYVPQNPPST